MSIYVKTSVDGEEVYLVNRGKRYVLNDHLDREDNLVIRFGSSGNGFISLTRSEAIVLKKS